MKNILIVSNNDMCRSRMAQQILNSFGRGMKISTAGILAGNSVPDVVCQVMEQNGYDFSRRKPCDVATYAQQTWDYVITLCPEAEEVQKEMQGVVRKYVSFNFTDPFQGGIHVEDEQEERVRALYDIMHKELYEFFRSELMENYCLAVPVAQIRIVGVSRNISKIIYVHHPVMVADLCHFEREVARKQ